MVTENCSCPQPIRIMDGSQLADCGATLARARQDFGLRKHPNESLPSVAFAHDQILAFIPVGGTPDRVLFALPKHFGTIVTSVEVHRPGQRARSRKISVESKLYLPNGAKPIDLRSGDVTITKDPDHPSGFSVQVKMRKPKGGVVVHDSGDLEFCLQGCEVVCLFASPFVCMACVAACWLFT